MSKGIFIGLDIGSCSVKAVEAFYEGGAPHIRKASCVEIPGDRKKRDSIIAAVKEAVKDFDVKNSVTISVVNSPKTSLSSFLLPEMPKKELAEAVKWELKNSLPYPLEGFLIDYEAQAVPEKGYNVTAAFSPLEVIENHMGILKDAGLKTLSLVTTGCAFKKFMERTHLTSGAICVIDLGELQSEIYIFSTPRSGQASKVLFSRKLPVAGADITKALIGVSISDKGRVELNADEAERIKKENGALQPLHILSMMRPQLERLAGEISRSLDYYKNTKDAAPIDKAILFGGTAGLKGLKEFFEDSLSVDVAFGNAFEEASAQFAPAVGAALSCGRGLNLIPPQIKEYAANIRKKLYMEGGVAAAVTLFVLFIVSMQLQISLLNKKMQAARLELSAISPEAEDTLHLRDKFMLFSDNVKKSAPWDEVLKELSNIVRPNMEITYLGGDRKKVTLKGLIFEEESKAIEEASSFITTLQDGMFRDVQLVSQKKSIATPGAFEFELRAEVK